ncbi:MAG: AAC(3) family N-acetyltransferase [Gaiellaceae bacterium MAG52_C11]|nr:AAC(3) family N-acetyltransferase [Candidatus Gaiellasilicea maunaloa]
MIGLGPGDRVLVHSSLRAVGLDADELIDELLAAVGPRGLVVMPTFTYDNETFTPDTPSRTGALTDVFRRRPEALRSLHPTYSVAAIGSGAAELLEGHERVAATDVESPLGRLAASGGLVLLLGVGHTSNTTVHVGEFEADAPYLEIPFDPAWPTHGYDRFPGCSRAFGFLERPLRERGAIRDGNVGRALAQLVPCRVVVEETVALLRADRTALLCTDRACYRCSYARERLS